MTPSPAERVVDALVAAHLLDPSAREESTAVVAGALEGSSPSASVRARPLPQLVEVVAYLGGALVLAAGVLFVAEQWGQLGFGAQVGLVSVSTIILLVAGSLAARVPADGPALRDPVNDLRRRSPAR